MWTNGPLQHDHKGRPLLLAMPRRMELMELAAGDLFATLGRLTVTQLKAIEPTAPYKPVMDALIAVRTFMGGEGSV